jgi:Zn finger protein HypA/HybF involved in hydrogenase expression
MSEIAGQTGHRGAATAVVNESYSFACMRCGDGWEQSYEIEHHLDAEGNEFVMYVAEGRVVPSPLSRPTCQNCDSHVVRIMRPGQVSSARNSQQRTVSARQPEPRAEAPETAAEEPREPHESHHWHLSDLLHPFHHRKAG